MSEVFVIGGGLSGSEAAYQAAELGASVTIYEMRPGKMTEAHKTGLLGELVCSNSLRSDSPESAHGLIKQELEAAGSLIMAAARATSVPAGGCLAVDRNLFAEFITAKIRTHPNIKIVYDEVASLSSFDTKSAVILATGPLTSLTLAEELQKMLGGQSLYFYDAISPIIDAESIDYEKAFFASRYGKGTGDDYLNCPMSAEEYDLFYNSLVNADKVTVRNFEDEKVFEGCMPIEVMAGRGKDTLRFGPLKPVGLIDPRTTLKPYAVIQLRAENIEKTSYNLVGCQTRLKYTEQSHVFRLVPGLEKAEFLRYGSIHRNTYIDSPRHLNKDLTLKSMPHIYIAGQITGVEGYLESTAMGLLAGIYAARKLRGLDETLPSRYTACGSLIEHITGSIAARPSTFQPSNINFGLLPPLSVPVRDKAKKRQAVAARALADWETFVAASNR
ncbi:methylenetetrahydrofolate--tRNA-(uracil(54)-C(5))-methyltransferase (FADH(2)-oxidizing) TrmFO [Candidatus Magnetominusculus xianensis]|uniref:Methylenetetrahydrofolate--tRNA-(uracil-5-)-methyltransferase TrmFO n=1 Tax=Candidatus Magnetominusculus xianensis TaxID=1748249 RepID=A0ABR5SDZ9_9BACT|nr:methylenetetrahydrofolate--tRNA-(uracil(54)-C(5))-methyltransferase (FADH(2)-oxidizing) TrmFO [Candidatus Magnetominusculus xianensis]KWT79694.1 tRNA (uracil-5-)-methyltransferase [Candidatus Magnetominusculus xianensis]MBF0404766.1 methylenetetrahydrofolate--tRNA-(uracil(54)-C(5))-methyltransferase (FADH(2)-oxidizing) TrmFO [Nitrospirota bacterium]